MVDDIRLQHSSYSIRGMLKCMLRGLPLIATILALSGPAIAETKTYSIGIVPQFETKRLHTIWRPILDELEQRTGLRLEIKGSPTIPSFEEELMAGNFDFSYMNPYHFMLASKSRGYIPLVRDVGRTLHGVLVVRKDSAIQAIEELNDRKIAFPAPNAVGASLQMRQELADRFNINVKPVYVKSHDSVYLNVLIGQTAAGGGVQKTLQEQPENIRRALRVVHTTAPIASHPIAAHPRVPEHIRNTFRDALIAIGATASGRRLLAEIPINQIGPASVEDYTPINEMGLNRFHSSSY